MINGAKTEKIPVFFKKIVLFAIGQLICFFLYPVFWLMRIRFIPVNYAYIGHLAIELDCYVKEGILGLHPSYKTIILIDRSNVANPHLVSYWKKYVTVIDNRIIYSLLWAPLRRNRLLGYDIGNYLHVGEHMVGNFMRPRYPEIQKQYYGRPPVLSLTGFDQKRGWTALNNIGVPEDAWFICVHCRERGYGYSRGRDAITIRDADVNNYLLAIQEIVNRGGWVIRVGDPTMKRIPRMKNVIDYAHLDIKSDWMDVFLCASCKFFLGSNSGLEDLSSVFGVKRAIANIAGPVSAVLPYGVQDIGIPKLIRSVKEDRLLTFKEIFSSPIADFPFDHLFAANDIEAIENSSEDIRDIATEMMDRLDGKLEYSEEDERLQERFKSFMRPSHYSYGAISRVGSKFLKKYEYLL
jgi:putative glycosyltransferase (TIGR04372 family)